MCRLDASGMVSNLLSHSIMVSDRETTRKLRLRHSNIRIHTFSSILCNHDEMKRCIKVEMGSYINGQMNGLINLNTFCSVFSSLVLVICHFNI